MPGFPSYQRRPLNSSSKRARRHAPDDVVAHAGVSKERFHLYLDSKEALFKSVIKESIVPLFVAAEQQMPDFRGQFLELLRHLLLSWWQQIGGTRLAGVSKLIISESSNSLKSRSITGKKVIERGRAPMRTVLQRIGRGEFRELDIETAIDVIFSPMLMLIVSRYSHRIRTHGAPPEVFLQTYFDLLLRGLCREEAPR